MKWISTSRMNDRKSGRSFRLALSRALIGPALLSGALLSCASGPLVLRAGAAGTSPTDPPDSITVITPEGLRIVTSLVLDKQLNAVLDLKNGQMEIDWSKMTEVLTGKSPEFRSLDASVLIDGVEDRPMPAGTTHYKTIFAKPGEQHDEIVIFRDPKTHKTVHESNYVLLEAFKSQTVDPKSFSNFMGDKALSLELPTGFVAQSGIDPALVKRSIEIGYGKVLWTLTPKAKPTTRAIAEKYGISLEVIGKLDSSGSPVSFALFAPTGEKLGNADVSEMQCQNDASFNGNAFFWDNQFVSLASLIHHPSLSASTMDFHYRAQDLVGNGVVPRETRHSNGVSFHRYHQVRFGVTTINDQYVNPNFTGWVESGLAATNPPSVSVTRLKRAISSMQRYADWIDQNRSVKDPAGHLVGYWTSNLSSGSDNAPRGGGNINKAHFSQDGWVDLLAQQVRMYQDMAHLSAELGDWQKSQTLKVHAGELKHLLDARYWNSEKGFYFDLLGDGKGQFTQDVYTPTQASFWPLLTGGLSTAQTDLFVKNWMTPDNFGGSFPAASLSSHHPDFHEEGGYWRGGRWPPSIAVLTRGFELQNRWDQAFAATRDFVARMSDVAHDHRKSEGKFTVYEFYGMQKDSSGVEKPIVGAEPGHVTREDFAGWGKLPMTYNLIRYVLGLRPVEPNLGGAANDRRWLKELSDSNANFFELFTDLAHTPNQLRMAARGYLEWNLGFDWPVNEVVTLKNFVFKGHAIAEMSLKKLGLDQYQISMTSDAPVVLQINRLFAKESDQAPGAHPLVGSAFVRVGGTPHADTAIVNLNHKAH